MKKFTMKGLKYMKYNLTPEEIIKAITACNNRKGGRCSKCPMLSKYKFGQCRLNVERQAVKLIEKLQQENAGLKELLEDQKDCTKIARGHYNQVRETNRELYEENKELKSRFAERPYGDDKIDELKQALDLVKFENEWLKETNKDLELQLKNMILLPCKVGDTVYHLVKCDDGDYRIFEMKVCSISFFGAIRNKNVWNCYLEDGYSKAYTSFYDFGKTVFLDLKEAEQVLKERE